MPLISIFLIGAGYWARSDDIDQIMETLTIRGGRKRIPSFALGRDALITVIRYSKPGLYYAIVNSDKEGQEGCHWMSVYWQKSRTDPVKVRIVDSLATRQFVRLIQRECWVAGYEVIGAEFMGWQRDGWKCGFYSIFNIFVAMWSGEADIRRLPVTKMPSAFVDLSLTIINRRRANRRDVTLKTTQQIALLRGVVDGLAEDIARRG